MSAIDETHTTIGLFAQRPMRGQCLARYLELSGLGIRIVAENSGNATNPVQPEGAIDIAVIDTGEHACSDASIETIFAWLAKEMPGVPIVVVSDRDDGAAVFEALRLGARAYVPSSLDPDILLETLRFVHKGGTFIPLDVLISVCEYRNIAQVAEVSAVETHGLTGAELRVLELLKRGQPNKVIARALDIEEGTVKVHVRRIMKKLHAANRTQVALLAQQSGRGQPLT
jgi:DNA-binding NarL/FixJ family response regulator